MAKELLSLDRNGPVTIHEQISSHIRKLVDSGFWPTGFQLPSEFELAQSLGVARGTIRRALQELTEANLLRQIQGKGTFVTSQLPNVMSQARTTLDGAILSNAQQLELAGIEYHDVLLKFSRTEVDEHRSGTFERKLKFKRLRVLREGPESVIETEVYLDRLPPSPTIEPGELTTGSFHALLRQKYDLQFAFAERIYSAELATGETAELLEVAENDPLLVHDQYTYDSQSNCIERSRAWARADRHKQTIIVRGLS